MKKLTDNIKLDTVVKEEKSFIRQTLESIQVEFIGESVSDVKPVDIDNICSILESKWNEELEKIKIKWQEQNLEYLKREFLAGKQITL